MKIVTLTTIRGLEGKGVYSPPGEYDVPANIGADLVRSGLAKPKAIAEAEAKAVAGQVSITQSAGPTITTPPPQVQVPDTAKEEEGDEVALADMKKPELVKLAADLSIEGADGMTKAQLVEAIEKAQSGGEGA